MVQQREDGDRKWCSGSGSSRKQSHRGIKSWSFAEKQLSLIGAWGEVGAWSRSQAGVRAQKALDAMLSNVSLA